MKNPVPAGTPDPIIVISLRPEPTGRAWPLAGGRVLVHAPRGINPLDRLLIEAAHELPGEAILTIQPPDALTALALAGLRPSARVTFFHLDLFHVTQASRLAARHQLANIDAVCAANLPAGEFRPELALMPVRRDAEAGLTLELLRQAHAALAVGGKLLAAVNNPNDTWLRRQLERIFGGLTRVGRDKNGVVYLCKRAAGAPDHEERLQFIKSHQVELGGLSLELESCYGVFSPAGFDEGSRALIEVMDPLAPGGAIFNPGCNWGALGLLAARKFETERLLMVDANSRAVQMARRNAERQMPGRAEVRHEFQGDHFLGDEEWGAFDAVVTNPPYATDFAVTAMFAQLAQQALRKGGRLYMVGKRNPHMVELVEKIFGEAEVRTRRGYMIAVAQRKG